ncbi:hypothetical protein [Altererythrobacter sp. MF3-039]|uniref:hypothetical protein n=1 Tax=Altererythrobacter sp. MF3-039 TaxID=3252901 RepID=UPI00390C7F92
MTDNGDRGIDWVERSGKRAKGRRPEFFEDPAVDRLYSMTLALAAEVSALRERQDTVERLLNENGTLSRADIEAYEPDKAAADERGLATKAYVARIMRGFQQAAEALEADDPPIMDWVEKLSKD